MHQEDLKIAIENVEVELDRIETLWTFNDCQESYKIEQFGFFLKELKRKYCKN
jgi:hypothetical protein